ncbi:hypothetical protein Tcan_12356 [Toxocara canis]|uniref:Uncharacterized protein n=1 Tax=Toxocara canis TaxID=6265 RepID=A0A0B2W5E4_TOXCA|nr:hypothetical protein Tcan_12356 [Toxocara canis]
MAICFLLMNDRIETTTTNNATTLWNVLRNRIIPTATIVMRNFLSTRSYWKQTVQRVDSVSARRLSGKRFEYSTLVTPKVSDEYLIYSPQRLHRFTFVCGREHDPVATREWSSLRAQIAVECEWDRTVLTSILNAMRFGNIDASCNKTNTRQSNGLIAEWAIVAPKGEIRIHIGSENAKKLKENLSIGATYAIFSISSERCVIECNTSKSDTRFVRNAKCDQNGNG